MKGADGIAGTADDVLVEGNPAAPITAGAVRTGHQFLIDIAHSAGPSAAARPGARQQRRDRRAQPAGTYDGELLDAHYIAGDGRANENIGLTAVHDIFHSEHNRLVAQAKDTVLAAARPELPERVAADAGCRAADLAGADRRAGVERRAAVPGGEVRHRDAVPASGVRGVRTHVQPLVDRVLRADPGVRRRPQPGDRRRVRAHGLSLRPLDADRDGRPVRPELQPGHRRSAASEQRSAAWPDRGVPQSAGLRGAAAPTPEEAASAIVRGTTRRSATRSTSSSPRHCATTCVGLPLDLAVLNLARGRDVGIPVAERGARDFYEQTGDSWLKPYTSWADSGAAPEASGIADQLHRRLRHARRITGATTLADKRAAAAAIVSRRRRGACATGSTS